MDFDLEQKEPKLKLSPLQKEQLKYRPTVPDSLQNLENLDFVETTPVTCEPVLRQMFPHTLRRKAIQLARNELPAKPVKVGVVLSGGQAAGGHNVLSGLFDALQELHPGSRLVGFLNGP